MMDSAPLADGAHQTSDEASVTVYENGPLIVRGPFVLRGMDGSAIDVGRQSAALCRCGYSAIKPFCDGSHRRAGFAASGSDERPRVAVSRDDAHGRPIPACEQLSTRSRVEPQARGGAPQDR